jgi:unsaturated rhamnogalacturonyl hydrolase
MKIMTSLLGTFTVMRHGNVRAQRNPECSRAERAKLRSACQGELSCHILSVVVSAIALALNATEAPANDRQSTLKIMQKAATWQMAHLGTFSDGDWIMGPLWNGFMALGRIPGNEVYTDKVEEVGRREQWRVIDTAWKANDHCTPQAYLELYESRHDAAMLGPTVKALDAFMAAADGQDENLDFKTQNNCKWSWCDALYMSPPTFARLARITGNRKYKEYLHKWWWEVSDYYYDKEEKLYYRDQHMFKLREANGRKVFWSRGNGWVVGGLVRVLQYLPNEDPFRARYAAQFKEMCGKLAEIQCPDGLWRSGLLDASAYPEPESSGSAFFVYALAYGINEGLLERSKYQPAVIMGWKGLESCVTPEGKFQNVQPVGDKPGRFRPDSSMPYGTGALLLAGSEVYRMLAKKE